MGFGRRLRSTINGRLFYLGFYPLGHLWFFLALHHCLGKLERLLLIFDSFPDLQIFESKFKFPDIFAQFQNLFFARLGVDETVFEDFIFDFEDQQLLHVHLHILEALFDCKGNIDEVVQDQGFNLIFLELFLLFLSIW